MELLELSLSNYTKMLVKIEEGKWEAQKKINWSTNHIHFSQLLSLSHHFPLLIQMKKGVEISVHLSPGLSAYLQLL